MSDRGDTGCVRAVGVGALLHQQQSPDRAAVQQRDMQALAAAHAAGWREGEAAAIAAADARFGSQRMAHAVALEATRAEQQALLESVGTNLSELALIVARAVVAAEPFARPETVRSLVAEALQPTPAAGVGTLYVADAMLESAAEGLPQGWALVADASLAPGMVRATIGSSTFTASLDRRLALLAARLAEPE